MHFISEDLEKYSEAHTSDESELLKKINRDTHAKVLKPRMLSGHLQGKFLSMISKMIKPAFVLEIGTYTGYSAICLAEGLQPQGKLITIDVNEELKNRVQKYFDESNFASKIDFRIGPAQKIIPTEYRIRSCIY
jgi:predicted O-methyltransferase YrrM